MAVYLIHFDKKLHHALHYVGYTEDIEKRIKRHNNGNGAAILRHLNNNNISYEIVKVWKDGGRKMEQYIKKQKNTKRYCPICTNKPLKPKKRKKRI